MPNLERRLSAEELRLRSRAKAVEAFFATLARRRLQPGIFGSLVEARSSDQSLPR